MPPIEQQHFGAVLRRERLAAGLSMRQLGAAAGIAPSTVHRLENGLLPMPRPDQLNRLARALGTDVEEFYIATGTADTLALPELPVYLRAKYGVSEADASRLEGYLQALRQSHDDTSSTEGKHDDKGGNTS